MTNGTGVKTQRLKAHLIMVERAGKRRRLYAVVQPTAEAALDVVRAAYPGAQITPVGGFGRALTRKLKLKRDEMRRV